MVLKVTLEMELVEGPERTADDVLDYVAAALGRGNTAKSPLRVTLHGQDPGADTDVTSTYECALVEA